jgi:hypothetical protein
MVTTLLPPRRSYPAKQTGNTTISDYIDEARTEKEGTQIIRDEYQSWEHAEAKERKKN